MQHHPIDPYFRVEVISQTPNPNQTIYAAMHTDYCEEFVFDQMDEFPSEEKAGEIIVKNLLAGHRGHWGPLEHPQITFNCGWFPHSAMQQITRHRLLTFDVQSSRYTGNRIVEAAEGKRDIEEVFYLRPVGAYTDRKGNRYQYTEEARQSDLEWCLMGAKRYAERIAEGFSEEHARGLIPFDVRQHWVMSGNARALSHLFTVRGKKDAQLEAQQLCQLSLPHFAAWVPAIHDWFMENQWLKGRLAP